MKGLEVKEITLNLTKPQENFVFSKSTHPGMVAGYGAGKSQAAVIRIIIKALQYPSMTFAFIEPTFDLIRLIAFPRFEEILRNWDIEYKLNKSDAIITLENGSKVIFRSAEVPSRLVGFECADAVIDEADTLKNAHATEVWNKMLGRIREKKPDGGQNTLAAVSTPEGFGWMYETFGKDLKQGYELIKAPTSSNPYLPSNYIDNLRATYPSNLLSAYLDGEFVNLTAGSIYHEFDRHLNQSREIITSNEPLHIGMDFNVGNMSASIWVTLNGNPHAVDELTGIYDTPAMISTIKDRYHGHAIFIYPDASGDNRKSNNASVTDLTLLRQAGFTVLNNQANPRVKDRILSVNAMICSGNERKLFVNSDKCPTLVEAFEKQCYDKNGEPDKQSGLDHIVDAAGYFLAYKYPIRKGFKTVQVVGL